MKIINSQSDAERDVMDEDDEIEVPAISKEQVAAEKVPAVQEGPITKADIAKMIAEALKPAEPAAKPKVVKKTLPLAIPDVEIDVDDEFPMIGWDK